MLAIDLADELDLDFPFLTFDIDNREEPEQIGARIRAWLGIPIALQKTWRDPRKSYNSWRALIEGVGILVFQVTRISPQEILGFSIPERPLPVIAVNRKLTPNERIFTLLHELIHVLLNQSSICDINEDEPRPAAEQDAEVFCNAVAAATLVPRKELLAEDSVARYSAEPHDWTDDELNSLARTFGVSTHVILRRLLTEGRTSKAFYGARQAMWSSMLESTHQADEDADDQLFRRNMPQEVVSDLGRPFTRLVLDSYENSFTSLSDVSRFLGLRAEQVEKVLQIVRS